MQGALRRPTQPGQHLRIRRRIAQLGDQILQRPQHPELRAGEDRHRRLVATLRAARSRVVVHPAKLGRKCRIDPPGPNFMTPASTDPPPVSAAMPPRNTLSGRDSHPGGSFEQLPSRLKRLEGELPQPGERLCRRHAAGSVLSGDHERVLRNAQDVQRSTRLACRRVLVPIPGFVRQAQVQSFACVSASPRPSRRPRPASPSL